MGMCEFHNSNKDALLTGSVWPARGICGYAVPMRMRTTLLAALLATAACGQAMQLTLQNGGTAVRVRALCGDASYEATLPPAGTVAWTPSANSCSVDVHAEGAGGRLTLLTQCLHAHGCAVTVKTAGQTATLADTGQLEVCPDSAAAERETSRGRVSDERPVRR